jgi:signal transduction histidine kinase
MVTQQPQASTRPERVLAQGVRTWRDGYLAWIRRHPRLVDAALVALLLWLCGIRVTGMHTTREAISLALIPVIVFPLVWRRRAPFVVFTIISAAALAQLFTGQPLSQDIALLVAAYTVAAYEPPRRILIAGAVLVAGSVPAAIEDSPPGIHVIWVWILLNGLVAAAGFSGYYVRTRRAYLASLVERAAWLERERDRDTQLAAAAERARIAREMHDIVAHNIAVMIALADGAVYTAEESPAQAVTLMGEVSATGRSALTDMRRLLGVMRQEDAPQHAPAPVLDNLGELLGTVRTAGLPVALAVTGDQSGLPPTAQLAIYRMIQEALTNTLKHAAASSARVSLSYRPGEVELEVTDDGQPSPASAGGHGIAGMRERAAVFGGTVSAGPLPGGGWRIHTVLSVDPAPRALRAAGREGG